MHWCVIKFNQTLNKWTQSELCMHANTQFFFSSSLLISIMVSNNQISDAILMNRTVLTRSDLYKDKCT